MKVCYNNKCNFDLGLLAHLHPFDGTKFRKVFNAIKDRPGVEFISPQHEISQSIIEQFVDPLISRYLKHKDHILRALEVPKIPFIGLDYVDKKILRPMRWGVAGTLLSAEEALKNGFCWNLSGGYHHASQHSIEGFCIYNDIGITCQELMARDLFKPEIKILIIDTDAHHGNGNARTFMEHDNVTILDVYNTDIYPTTASTRQRVDVSVALNTGVQGKQYLDSYQKGLSQLTGDYDLAFVVAGTDVLSSDKLGGFQLSLEDVVQREIMTVEFLKDRKIPGVMLSGGGYSKESSGAISEALLRVI
jgi:histone deacetylase 11